LSDTAVSDTAFPATDLPTDRVQNHAAFLMQAPGGPLMCAWFAGTMEGKSDISIHLSRLGPEGWSPAERLSDDPDRSEQNPVLFPDPQGGLWLIYTAQPGGRQQDCEVRFRRSDDGGATWSEPRRLLETRGTFVRQPVRVTADGRWLLPVFRCRTEAGEAWTGEIDDSAVMVSRDRGATWDEVAVLGSLGCVHMNIVPLDGDEMVAFFRSRWADHVWRSRSTDAGRTWSAPEPSGLPNNNSSVQAIRLADGRVAIVYNHASRADAQGRRLSLYDEIEGDDPAAAQPGRAFWGAPRAPLSLAVSEDGGRTWARRLDLAFSDGHCLSNNSADKVNRELSYPSIFQTADGTVHVAYTHFRQTIRHMVLPLSALA
jgi:predicted neuraminidase